MTIFIVHRDSLMLNTQGLFMSIKGHQLAIWYEVYTSSIRS